MPRSAVLARSLVLLVSTGFFVFICWIIYLADTGQGSIFFDLVKLLPYGDKIGHFCLFGPLTLGINAALRFKKSRLLGGIQLGSLLVCSFVLLEELSQHYFPGRTLDVFDLFADGAGIALFTWLSSRVDRRLEQRNSAAPPQLPVSS